MRRKNTTSEMMMAYIAEALVVLMQHKPYTSITIGEITEKAGVNRSTYYRHFETKEAIIRFYLDAIMNEYLDKFKKKSGAVYKDYMSIMFDTFYSHKNALLAIHKAGLSLQLSEILMKHFHFDEIELHAPLIQQFKASYHIGGIYNNMLLWFSHDMKETPSEMTRIAMSYKPDKAVTLFNMV